MTVRLQRPAPYLEFDAGGMAHRVDLTTKDIGCTIGTELRYVGPARSLTSVRLVAYRPGTRHHDRAEEIAAEHLTKALEKYRAGSRFSLAGVEGLAECLRDVVTEDGRQLWDPENEEDEWS
ncbi:hypothetical protein ACIGW0_31435 [Streptomyces bikiniensis]|uniref:Uncharacterized protein n=1 Tax=Streptomyces bikiniensis TaxID=1896 RepID=A0ABW8D252_STRBI